MKYAQGDYVNSDGVSFWRWADAAQATYRVFASWFKGGTGYRSNQAIQLDAVVDDFGSLVVVRGLAGQEPAR